jgi:hypothetical protein
VDCRRYHRHARRAAAAATERQKKAQFWSLPRCTWHNFWQVCQLRQ